MKKDEIGLMIDLETLGTDPHCVIRQIAVVAFKFDELIPLESICVYPSEEEQMKNGRTILKSTLAWWQKFAKDEDEKLKERQKLYSNPCKICAKCVLDFITEEKKMYDVYIVARGATTFDVPILSDFFKQYLGAPLRHPFYRIMDLRSFTSIFKAITGEELVSKADTKHDGYSDCVEQIRQLRRFHEKYTNK